MSFSEKCIVNEIHEWKIIRCNPPLSFCWRCKLCVNKLLGDNELNYYTDKWKCKKCNKPQDKPNLNGSFCVPCWNKWREPIRDYTVKKTTSSHPNHKFSKTCKICMNKFLKENTVELQCPNCSYYTLIRVTNKIGLELGAEIRCENCYTHWRRTKNW